MLDKITFENLERLWNFKPIPKEAIFLLSIPLTKEKFEEESVSKNGKEFIVNLRKKGKTWNDYEGIVRVIKRYLTKIEDSGGKIVFHSTLEDLIKAVNEEKYPLISQLCHNVKGNNIEMADRVVSISKIEKHIRKVRSRQNKINFFLRLITCSGQKMAADISDKGNVTSFNYQLIPPASAVYLYWKLLTKLNGKISIIEAENEAEQEYLNEARDGKLPSDVECDLRVIQIYKV